MTIQIASQRPVRHPARRWFDGAGTMTEKPTIYILDSDPQSRQHIESLAAGLRMDSQTLASAQTLVSLDAVQRACVVADAAALSASSLAQQHVLRKPGVPPVIVTGRGLDVAAATRWMERGAHTVVEQPLDSSRLAEAVHAAVKWDETWRSISRRYEHLRRSVNSLSERERRVLELMTQGMQNKSIARRMDLSVRMIETYRAQVRKKLNADSAPELAAKFAELQLLQRTLFHPDAETRATFVRTTALRNRHGDEDS